MASYNELHTDWFNWVVPFQRTGAFPLDRTDIFDSLEDAQKYTKGDGSDKRNLGLTSYVGQIIVVYENDTVDAYIIKIDDKGQRFLDKVGKDIDLSSYYTKTEIDTKLNTKANTSSVYTQTQANNKFRTKTDSYSKAETEELIDEKINGTLGALNELLIELDTGTGV